MLSGNICIPALHHIEEYDTDRTRYEIVFSTLHVIKFSRDHHLDVKDFPLIPLSFDFVYILTCLTLNVNVKQWFLRNASGSGIFAPFGVYYSVPCDPSQ